MPTPPTSSTPALAALISAPPRFRLTWHLAGSEGAGSDMRGHPHSGPCRTPEWRESLPAPWLKGFQASESDVPATLG